MDPGYMEMMATTVQNGTYLYCPDGGHMAMYDDQLTYFEGLVNFLLGEA
jgi:proline iminopeptidase